MRGIPFWLKLLGAFLVVIVVAAGGVAVLANRSASRELSTYVSRGRAFRSQALAPTFADYYQREGGWQGVAELARSLAQDLAQGGPGRGGMGWGLPSADGMQPAEGRIVIAGPNGQIVADSAGALAGRRLSAEDLAYGARLEVGGELRGYLLVGQLLDQSSTFEAQLLHGITRALLLAALLAGGAALLLALLLSRGLTGPLHSLATAAGRLAAGQRGLRVELTGGGEVGLLGRSLNSLAESLEQQEALRRQLIADIAHELRTPLAVIRGNLEALLDGIYRPTPETIAPIHEEALLLSRLVDELRDLALAEAGQLPLHLARVDPAELVRGVLAGWAAQADERSIDLELLLPGRELPEVEVDAGRIRQVLGNLLSNALRYAPQRGRVEVALEQTAPAWVQVRIGDNGPGISPNDLPHVLDGFYRGARARTRDGSGADLGLAIARQWVEAHGGEIRVESALGQGTSFCFTLPVSKTGN